MTRRFRNKRDKSRTSRAKLPCWALLEPVPAHCKTSTPAQHLLGYSMHSTPPVGLCPRCSLCPCLLQVSSFRGILWTLRSFLPSLRREAASPGTTEVPIPSAADKLQLPCSPSCRLVPALPVSPPPPYAQMQRSPPPLAQFPSLGHTACLVSHELAS